MSPRNLSVVVVVALSAGLAGQAPEPSRTEAAARRVNNRIQALQNEADGLVGQSRTLLGDLRKLEIDRQIQVERVRQAEAAVAESQAAVAEAADDLEQLEAQRLAQLPELQTQLVDIYKRGRAGYARLLLGGNGGKELGRATRAVSALMRLNRQRIAEHLETLDAVRREQQRLDAEIPTLRASEAAARQAQTAAARALAARTALLAQIDAQRDLNAQLAGELQVAYERLQQQAGNLGVGRAASSVAVPLAPFRGALDWPVAGRMAALFGQPSARLGDSVVSNGVEIAALEGTPVGAIHPGTVSFADTFTGFGNLVIIDHGADAYSLYGYLEAVSVSRGDAVESGSEIARVGAPPAGPSVLYLEIRVDGRSVDPVEWLKPR
jgi:septal ring factor EnvC (AmiA/AmiB activator)